MNEERKELLDEANALGLEFPANVKTSKLKEMIAEEKGEPLPVEETAPASPTAKVEPESNDSQEEKSKEIKKESTQNLSKHQKKRQRIAEAKKRAFKKRVVTITNKDNRENDIMTTAYLSFENQYFGLSKVVPLDVPVELEEALIHIAEKSIMTLHKDEIVGGKRTGNKRTVRVKKFAISYGKETAG